ncbi:MAG: hypothetical protein RLO02_03435 [Roseitalea porphyridii]
MFHVKKSRPLLAATMLVLAGLVAGCESDIDRQMRQEREALKKAGELEELEGQLNTQNPDPYSKEEIGTKNIGRSRQN